MHDLSFRSDALDVEEREKFLEAEGHAAWVRLFLSFAGVAYLLLTRDDPRVDWFLGWGTLAIIWAYSLAILVFRPYRHPAFRYVTTTLDAIFSTIWVAATGGWLSSWYPLYLAITVATAFRFDYRETFAAGIAYSVLFVGMLTFTGTIPVDAPEELGLKVVFILVIAALSGPLARRALRHAVDRAAAEEEARQTRRLDSLKDQFFANVSHELRTPLALVMGPAERLLSSEDLGEKARKDVATILSNSRALLEHVDDLLQLSRLESGKLALEYTRVDAVELVRQMAGNFDARAKVRGIDFTVEAPDELETEFDPHKYERILQNLLSNAFEFTDDHGTIRVSLRARGDDPELLVLEVADDGPGVKPEHRARIFERYEGFDPPHPRELGGGSGLGLAMVKNLAELHRGTVHVADAPEGGALFGVSIPRWAPAGATVLEERRPSASWPPITLSAKRPELEPQEAPPTADALAFRPTVLVVDDNEEMNRFICESLSDRYETERAFDGEEGLQKALSGSPDLILTDVMMPGISGEKLVREIRARPRLDAIPIVVLTARAREDVRLGLLQGGAQDFLTKPFRADELRARVGNLVSAKLAQDVLRAELETTTTDLAELARESVQRARQLEAARDSLRVACEQAERASQLKSDFLGAVSHELRTPLASLSLHLERMRRMSDELPDEADDIVERMSAQMDRLMKLIEGLLSYARVKGRELSVDVEEFSPAIVVAESIDDVRAPAERKGLTLSVAMSDGVDTFSGDGSLVRLIVLSLLGNAVKFTEVGGVTVTVAQTDGQLEISVEDTGPGIPPDAHMRIFEPFEQLAGARRTQRGGLGLGLSLVRELVVSLGGTISLDSDVGRGSTFTVQLPPLSSVPTSEERTDGRDSSTGGGRGGSALESGPAVGG